MSWKICYLIFKGFNMFKGVNKVFILGVLGVDPDVRYTSSGKPVVNISVATTYSYKNKSSGEFSSKTEWHKIVLYDKLNEFVSEYLKKGSKVYIEGFLRTDKWQGKDGIVRYSTGIIAVDIQILSFKNQNLSNNSVDITKENENLDIEDKKDENYKKNENNKGVFKDVPF